MRQTFRCPRKLTAPLILKLANFYVRVRPPRPWIPLLEVQIGSQASVARRIVAQPEVVILRYCTTADSLFVLLADRRYCVSQPPHRGWHVWRYSPRLRVWDSSVRGPVKIWKQWVSALCISVGEPGTGVPSHGSGSWGWSQYGQFWSRGSASNQACVCKLRIVLICLVCVQTNDWTTVKS